MMINPTRLVVSSEDGICHEAHCKGIKEAKELVTKLKKGAYRTRAVWIWDWYSGRVLKSY